MDNKKDFLYIVIFPPHCGGKHLANLIATHLTSFKEEEYLKYYNTIDKDITDNMMFWFNPMAYNTIRWCHGNDAAIRGCLRAIDPDLNPLRKDTIPKIFLIKLPENNLLYRQKQWNSVKYFKDKIYYDSDFVSRTYNVQTDNIISIQPEDLFMSKIDSLLDMIYNNVPINISLCKQMHSIWFDRIKLI